ELAKALKDAKVSLQRGLTASAKEGKPISGKYEVEHGKLQLSVYTMKGNAFSEVIVDHKTGKVTKTEAISGGEDLTAAKAQSEAVPRSCRVRSREGEQGLPRRQRHARTQGRPSRR